VSNISLPPNQSPLRHRCRNPRCGGKLRAAQIKRRHPPVNILGGYRFPGAPEIDLSPTDLPPTTIVIAVSATPPTRREKEAAALQCDDLLVVGWRTPECHENNNFGPSGHASAHRSINPGFSGIEPARIRKHAHDKSNFTRC
jgi:hypothetical protein